jgi:tetratricopeptide (TPR) repeat protein
MAKRSKKLKRVQPSMRAIAPAMTSSKTPSAWSFPSGWMLLLLKALVIVVAGAWIFSPVLNGGWYGDDDIYLLTNTLLNDPRRLWKAWFEPGSFIEYYPIEQTVQWCQFQLWGLKDAYNYLTTNLVLHLISALLLWRLLSKLELKLAWLGGLIFAIHPVFVDSIGASCELKNTLSLPPFLLAMSFYLDFERDQKKRDYILALLLFLVAMLCKITMEFFPIVILAFTWWKRGRITRNDCLASAPFFVISLVLAWTTIHAGHVYARTIHYVSPGPIHLGGASDRIALAGLCLGFYLGHSFFPLHPMPYYPLWPMEPLTPWHFIPWLGIALVLSCCWMKRHSWGRPVLFALIFFVLGLAPFLGFNQVSYMCLLWVQDHLLYIPIIALIALVVAGLEHGAGLLPKKLLPLGIAALTVALALLGFQASTYAKLFADREQLWRYNLQYNPNMWLVRYLLGNLLASKGDLEGGIEQLRDSIRINPDFCNAHLSLGIILHSMGKPSEAIDAFQGALRVNSDYAVARLDLAIVLAQTHRTAEAIEQYNILLKSQPDIIRIRYYLACALLETGRYADAIDQYHQVLTAQPSYPKAHENLAEALAKMGRIPEAIEQLNAELQLYPDDVETRNNLAKAEKLLKTGSEKP